MKKSVKLFSFIIVLGLMLSACGGGAPATSAPAAATEAPVMTEAPAAATEAPAMTEAPADTPTFNSVGL